MCVKCLLLKKCVTVLIIYGQTVGRLCECTTAQTSMQDILAGNSHHSKALKKILVSELVSAN